MKPLHRLLQVPEVLKALILSLHDVVLESEERMVELEGEFNEIFSNSPLRLRPWPRRKGAPPYAIYWIFFPAKVVRFSRARLKLSRSSQESPRRYKRPKIRTTQDLDDQIWKAGLSDRRPIVRSFHTRVLAVNLAHKVASRALDLVRKILDAPLRSRLPGGKAPKAEPKFIPAGTSSNIRRLLDLLSGFWSLLCLRIRQLHDHAYWQQENAPCTPLCLTWSEDQHHPYGRLLWRHEWTGKKYTRMTDRDKRRLGVPRALRRKITVLERKRRILMKHRIKLIAVFGELRTRLTCALKVSKVALAESRIPIDVAPPASGGAPKYGGARKWGTDSPEEDPQLEIAL